GKGDGRWDAEGERRFGGGPLRSAAAPHANGSAGPAAGGRADGRAFTAAGYRADHRAEAGACADLRRVFLLSGISLLGVRVGRKRDLTPVGELQTTQPDRQYGPPTHSPARIGVDDFSLDQRAPLGDHPIAVDDGVRQAACKTIAVLVKFGCDRLVRGDRNGRALANRKDAGRRRRVLTCGRSRFLPRGARWRGRRVTRIRLRV